MNFSVNILYCWVWIRVTWRHSREIRRQPAGLTFAVTGSNRCLCVTAFHLKHNAGPATLMSLMFLSVMPRRIMFVLTCPKRRNKHYATCCTCPKDHNSNKCRGYNLETCGINLLARKFCFFFASVKESYFFSIEQEMLESLKINISKNYGYGVTRGKWKSESNIPRSTRINWLDILVF